MSRYFVLLRNPSNGARFALVKSQDQDVAMFATEDEAEEAAGRTLFGGGGFFEVFDVRRKA